MHRQNHQRGSQIWQIYVRSNHPRRSFVDTDWPHCQASRCVVFHTVQAPRVKLNSTNEQKGISDIPLGEGGYMLYSIRPNLESFKSSNNGTMTHFSPALQRIRIKCTWRMTSQSCWSSHVNGKLKTDPRLEHLHAVSNVHDHGARPGMHSPQLEHPLKPLHVPGHMAQRQQ